MKTAHLLAAAALTLIASCGTTHSQVTQKDARGNYVTTSDYRAMERADFEMAMAAGLTDFDQSVTDLRLRANELGGESLKDFSDWAKKLDKRRTDFNNELQKSTAMLAADWPKQREDTLESFDGMRKCLDSAYDDVLDL